MTRWGTFLLVVFLVLGLSNKPESKAITAGIWAATIIVTVVMAKTVR